jgi:hypothetical protein
VWSRPWPTVYVISTTFIGFRADARCSRGISAIPENSETFLGDLLLETRRFSIRFFTPSAMARLYSISQTRFAGFHRPPACLTYHCSAASFAPTRTPTTSGVPAILACGDQRARSTISSTVLNRGRTPHRNGKIRAPVGNHPGAGASWFPFGRVRVRVWLALFALTNKRGPGCQRP